MIVRFPAVLAVAASIFVGKSFASHGQEIAAQEKRTASVGSTTSKPSARVTNTTHVYLLRGLMNIFSLGMDDLAQKLQRRGISASVYNHSEWQTLADEIAAKYKAGNKAPIILVGHSLGADAVMFMGEYLGKKGVPVALVVPFDGTGSFAASANVQRVMNLTQRDYAYMKRGPGFRGELNNIDLSGQGYGHIDIDKSDRLHNMVINKIVGVVGRGGATRSATPRSRPADAPAAAPVPAAAPAAPAVAPGTSGSVAPATRAASTDGAASEMSSSSATGSTAPQKPAVRF